MTQNTLRAIENEVASPDTAPAQASPNKRKKLFAALGAAVILAGAGYGGYWTMFASHLVSTDNAYVGA